MYQTIRLTLPQLVYYAVLVTLLVSAGFLVWRRVQKVKTRGEAVFAGFGGLGLFVGLILGLSASPIVNAFMAAAFTLAGILLPLFEKTPAAGKPKTDRVRWMVPFGFAAVLGVFAGIAVRANDLLVAPDTPLRDRILAQGFTAEQADAMLKRWTEKATIADIVVRPESKLRGPLLSSSNTTDAAPAPPAPPLSDESRKALADPSKTLTPDQRISLLSHDPAMRARIELLRERSVDPLTAEDLLKLLQKELSK